MIGEVSDRRDRSNLQKPLVALVDDEPGIRETVGFALGRAGFRTSLYADGADAWADFEQGLPDLAILDILMPRMDGLELCRRIRSMSAEIPLVFLTSKDEEIDRILGLELGADDYLCKPFSTRELIARVRVLFRRAALSGAQRSDGSSPESELMHRGNLSLDLQRYTAHWDGLPLRLTVTEFRLLQALIEQPGHVRTRDQLLAAAYPDDTYVSERSVDTHVKRIRKKLIDLDPGFSLIEAVYGLGYRYTDDEREIGRGEAKE